MGALGQGEREAVIVPHGTVDEPHCGDEANGSQHTDGREVLHGVHAIVLQDGEGRGVLQGDGGHVEAYADGIHRDEGALVGQLIAEARLIALPPATEHGGASHEMTKTQQSLRLDILVGHDAHEGGHEDGDKTLDGVEPGYRRTQAGSAEIIAHACEVGSPDSELQEAHYCQTYFHVHSLLVISLLRYFVITL